MVIGACGDNCNECPRFRATEDGSEESLSEVAHLWLRLGFRDRLVSNDEIRCYGCRPENNCAYRELRDCAFQRRLTNCGMCHGYPCELTELAFRKSAELRKRIERSPEFIRGYAAFFRKKENLENG